MSKEKRTFNIEVVTSSSFRLMQSAASQQKRMENPPPGFSNKQYLSPELITRLAERIKKL